jgi:hypothetical protein
VVRELLESCYAAALCRERKTQSERFIDMARELGCDEDEAAFKANLGQIARHKPGDEPEAKKRLPKAGR